MESQENEGLGAHRERLREMALHSLGIRKLRGCLIAASQSDTQKVIKST